MSSKCIGIDKTSPSFCNFCSHEFYREGFYRTVSQKEDGTFPISECLAKNFIDKDLDMEIFVSNRSCEVEPCLGTKEYPFPDLIYGENNVVLN